MADIEKVKNLLIKLDLKYKATKDQLNTNGIMVLVDFDKEYKEFNTINALDVLNNIENKLAINEKALELAVDFIEDITGSCPYDSELIEMQNKCVECTDDIKICWNEYFKTKSKEMLENE